MTHILLRQWLPGMRGIKLGCAPCKGPFNLTSQPSSTIYLLPGQLPKQICTSIMSPRWCDLCDEGFTSNELLMEHVELSVKHSKCWRCDQKLLSPYSIPDRDHQYKSTSRSWASALQQLTSP